MVLDQGLAEAGIRRGKPSSRRASLSRSPVPILGACALGRIFRLAFAAVDQAVARGDEGEGDVVPEDGAHAGAGGW